MKARKDEGPAVEARGIAFFMSSRNLAEVDRLADRFGIVLAIVRVERADNSR